MKPSVGRIVHMTRFGKCNAAIVFEVDPLTLSPEIGTDLVGLTVFPECASLSPIAVGESGVNGTWHWPERVEEH